MSRRSLGWIVVAVLTIGGIAAAGAWLDRESTLLGPFLRAAFAARSRFAEDELRLAVSRGIRQYVILGAGYDTFAYRNPFADLRVFEVDHPATQESKRRRLEEAQIAIPPQTVYVAIDFASMSLDEALAASGFDTSAPSFFRPRKGGRSQTAPRRGHCGFPTVR